LLKTVKGFCCLMQEIKNGIDRTHLKSLRIYGSVLNALTITGYKGIDPEVSTDGLTPGYDTRDRYPSVRSFTFGVNVKF